MADGKQATTKKSGKEPTRFKVTSIVNYQNGGKKIELRPVGSKRGDDRSLWIYTATGLIDGAEVEFFTEYCIEFTRVEQ